MRSKYKWIFTLLMALTMQLSFAQEKTVTGEVTDGGVPLPGVSVLIKGTSKGTQTDVNGKFTITAKSGDVLLFSFIGMKDSAIPVGKSNNIRVPMTSEAQNLKDVVVEGYRSTTKSSTIVAQQTVKAATIENRPNASFMATLQGQVAGLNITSGSGQPGTKTAVIIRGAGTANGNTDPLYVIDGLPTNGDNFRSLNPNDIESVTVLKDASAIAVYGNRGANGVIVVKTKRGGTSGEKTKFRYSTSTGFTTIQRAKYDFTNSKQLLTLEKNYGVGLGSTLTDQQISDYSVNTDWVNHFFETASSVDHQFSVENSGKNLNSYSSLSYTDQKGILSSTGLQRFTLRNNLTGKSNDGKFTYSTNLMMGLSKNNEASSLGTGSINQNYVLGATLSAPYIAPSDYTGSADLVNLYYNTGSLLYTPLMLMDKLKTAGNSTEEFRLMASTDLGYKLNKDFTLRSRTGMETIESRNLAYSLPTSFNSILFKNPAAEFGGFEDNNNRREYRFNNLWQLDYKKSIDKHSFNGLLNAEYNYAQVNSNNMRQSGLDPRTYVPGTGSGYLADIAAHDFYGGRISSSKLKYNLISYFGILDYDFDSRFGLSGTYRIDGTSRFAKDLAWGKFWSLGGRWNINNESFMRDQNLVQVLKLRASYGLTGNQRVVNGTEFSGIIPPGFLDTYGNATNVYNGQSGYGITFGYPDLHWETTKQGNIGLDFELLRNKFRGTVDLYHKKTTDLFFATPVSPISGTTSITKNSDVFVINKGVELTLAYDLVRKKDFKFTLRANGSYNKNVIDGIKENDGKIISGGSITQNGGQIFEFYNIPYAGVNPVNGNLLFKAADGTLTETPSVDRDRVSTGKSSLPVYQGGFGFDADYKGFFLTSTFTYVAKVWRFDYDLAGLYDPTALGQFVATADLLNAWTPTNTNTSVPSLTASNLGTADDSDRFLRDASYIRMRHLQLGYKMPKKYLEKTFINDLSFYVQGQNLVTFTKWKGFDAESNRAADQGQYPTPRIFSIGMDLKF